MTVPDFQTLMRPLLDQYAPSTERAISDVRSALADSFALSAEERAERLPSGSARTFDNRVGWAATYLNRCGLLDRPRRGVYRITDRGRQVLTDHPDRVDLSVLSQFPEFDEFRATRAHRQRVVTQPPVVEQTPEERIEAAYGELRTALIGELRDRISAMLRADFEDLVLDVLHAMGYGEEGEGSRLRTSDRGIDGVIRQDRLGLDAGYVRAKRWEATVGRPVVQGFVGALQGPRAMKGIIFSASDFSSDARVRSDSFSSRCAGRR
jgi:restriction system protein